MDTTWIQVFILTISECIAPAGKTVCQPNEFELTFLTRADCETALEQLVSLKTDAEDVIVNADESQCVPSARQQPAYDSLADINAAFAGQPGWRAPVAEDTVPDPAGLSHDDRLANLPTCEASQGVAPCKVGSIIIEPDPSQAVEVWRKRQ